MHDTILRLHDARDGAPARRGLLAAMAAMAVLAVLGGCAHLPMPAFGPAAPRAAIDHGNPIQLNEAAVASAASGDVDAAWLLLERAARLAPHDERIVANLAALREYCAATPRGAIVGIALPSAAPRRPQPSRFGAPAETPAIWPAAPGAAATGSARGAVPPNK